MLEELGFETCLKKNGISQRDRNLIIGSIIGRLLHPASDLSTFRWLVESSSLGELLDFDYLNTSLNAFYMSADRLLEKKEEIERYLYNKEKSDWPNIYLTSKAYKELIADKRLSCDISLRRKAKEMLK